MSFYKKYSFSIAFLFGLLCFACTKKASTELQDSNDKVEEAWYVDASESELLDSVQQQTFHYFWEFAEPNSGLARERYIPSGIYPLNDANTVTTGGSGFGIMSIIVGIERGLISREQGMDRLNKIVSFLEQADRFHGVWPHWLDGETGKTIPFSKKDDGADLVESSFLIQGLLCVRQYCDIENEQEAELASRINSLWEEMQYSWHTKNNSGAIYWHWSPNYKWEMNFPLRGYDETLITYILGASSPKYPIDKSTYDNGWARSGDIVAEDEAYGVKRVLDHYSGNVDSPFGPLFWAHYSYLGLDPEGLSDQYADYWQLNKNHSLAHYNYAVSNPKHFKGYGSNLWGMTSSYTRNEDGSVGYTSHRPGRDNGVISPTAAISSIPYTPTESIAAIREFYSYPELLGPAGFYDAFSPEYNWVVDRYLAIDQGPMIVMIENYRTGLLWNLFMSCPEIKQGLTTLGFTSTKYDL